MLKLRETMRGKLKETMRGKLNVARESRSG